MMITESYDDRTESLVSLKDFYGERKQLIERCVAVFSHELYDSLLKSRACRKIAEIVSVNGSCPVYSFLCGDKETGFYLSPIGSSLAAQAVIEVSWVTGASRFVMFGSAGSLDPERTSGKYVIPTESYRDEGMSYHYAPPQDYIRIANWEKVSKIMDSLHLPYAAGRVWTTDAFLRETEGQVRKRKEEGCIAVEMELAGVQAVCDFHGLELYAFLVTGDVFTESGYDNSGLQGANHGMENLYTALAIAERI